MKIYISGGCKNGKSYHAQRCAKELARISGTPLYYIATMIPHDEEDDERIKRHIKDREGWGFETVEQGRDLKKILEEHPAEGTYLLDSVTALLSNEMFSEEGIDEESYIKVCEDIVYVASQVENIVIVSDYIYSDANRYEELTESYRKGLGYIEVALGEVCDRVMEVAYGQVLTYKR